MNELHLFTGAGGGILGGQLLGYTCVCAVEIEDYPRKVLLQRQRDGFLPKFPIWDDVRTFDGKSWRGKVDCVCGGFPCQDISVAGKKAGIEGERSGLWSEFARIIGEVRPQYAFVENSPMLTIRGLGRVLGDLSEIGYDARWCVMGADDVGAPHARERIWILAQENLLNSCGDRGIPSEFHTRTIQIPQSFIGKHNRANIIRASTWWENDPADKDGAFESQLGRVANGVDNRVNRLKAIGNGQVPIVAATAFNLLKKRLT